jgi:tRNA threonylcarbamoyladenosine biosynthesis protein TsaB
MRILAVDTATKSCSIAVTEKQTVLAELTNTNGRTHSIHLLDMIHAVIQTAGLTVAALDGFAVTKGPGSFTGLRIGISTIKGLAMAVNKPVVGISSLETLAQQAGSGSDSDLICPLIDARKGEVYFAAYRFSADGLKIEKKEMVSAPDEVVKDICEPCIFVGSGAILYRELTADKLGDFARFAAQSQHTIRASTVARLSLKRFEDGHIGEVAELVPHYIRKSDAELNLGKKQIKSD